MRRAMVATPASPARKTTTITPMPTLWIRSDGMKPNRARVAVSCGPWPAYMKSAKSAARAIAKAVPTRGCRYIVLARRVRS